MTTHRLARASELIAELTGAAFKHFKRMLELENEFVWWNAEALAYNTERYQTLMARSTKLTAWFERSVAKESHA